MGMDNIRIQTLQNTPDPQGCQDNRGKSIGNRENIDADRVIERSVHKKFRGFWIIKGDEGDPVVRSKIFDPAPGMD